MIIGMPISTFLGIMIWPFVYTIAAFVVYGIMKKQDDEIDDTEFEQSVKGRGGSTLNESRSYRTDCLLYRNGQHGSLLEPARQEL